MIPSARLRSILDIAVPIILALFSQTVLNLVDTRMVRDLGNTALAAVGIASFANFMAGAPIQGLAAGVQAMAARRIGEGRADIAARPLNGGLLVCLAFGVPWVLVIAASAPWWFPRLAGDADIASVGLPYLLCRLGGSVLIGMHFSFRAFWNATGRSKFYMATLLSMHALNIFLNWVLIYGKLGAPALGVLGAGLANLAAAIIGVSMHFVLGARMARHQGFLHGLPTRDTLRTMLRISLPTSISQLFFAGGLTALMAILARAGTDVAAASKVLMDLVIAGLLPAIAYGLAGTTLVSQSLGRRDFGDAKRWGREVAMVAFVTVMLLALPVLLAPDLVLSGFLKDASTIDLARGPLRLVCLTIGFDAVGMVLQNCLLGAGDSRRVMLVTLLMQWGLLLPTVAVMVLVFDLGLLPVWALQGAYRMVQAGVLARMWNGGKWAHIQV